MDLSDDFDMKAPPKPRSRPSAAGSSSSSSGSGDAKISVTPWVEKYRPKNLDQVSHQEEVVATLRKTLQTANLPHLLFYGPPGTGKTSTILAVARELYGPDLIKKRVLELNASNERGIDVIRDKVKTFAQGAVGARDNVPGFPCPPYKIIILDEADSMTHDAQSALRRTMELYTKVTRFCIICNYLSRIIEPITSRCAKFRFKPLPMAPMVSRLQTIASAEGIRTNDETLGALVTISEGDLRKAITLMQSAQRMLKPGEQLQKEAVQEVAGVIPAAVVTGLIKAIKANSFKHIQIAADETIAAGYPVDQVLAQLQPAIIADPQLSDTQKATVCLRIAEADKKLVDGADEWLQLLDVLSFASTTAHAPSS